MSILSKLQDLRTEEDTPPADVTMAELWAHISQMIASQTTTWVTVTATAPQPDTQVLWPAGLTRGQVIFYDYI